MNPRPLNFRWTVLAFSAFAVAPVALSLPGCGGGKKLDVVALEDLGAKFTLDDGGKPIKVGLVGSRITDADLAHLKSLTTLTHVNFSGAKVTDKGVETLAALPNLEALGFANTGLTDNGLKTVGKLPLKVLLLLKADITDQGLEHLKGMTTLISLNISGTKATEAGVSALRKALPKCNITF